MILSRTDPVTVIAEGTHMSGDLVFASQTHVYGTVEGNIELEGKDPIQIGKSAYVLGNISSKGPITVEGRVHGDIRSQSKILLYPTAQVEGSLHSPSIAIQPGARMDGEIRVIESEPSRVRGAA